jgi:fatty acid-binding protein DegV
MVETMEKGSIQDARLYPIGSVIGTHTGSGAITVAYVKKAV